MKLRSMPRGADGGDCDRHARVWRPAISICRDQMGFIAARFSGLTISPAVPAWLTPLSATLLHANFIHIAMNFLLLAYCGRQVESVLGASPLILLYVLGAYGAAACQYVLDPRSMVPMIGASGAISALVGAYAVSFGQPKRVVDSLRVNRWIKSPG